MNKGVQSPENGKIQVTREMLLAGIDALSGYDPEWHNPRDVVVEIYEAMTSKLYLNTSNQNLGNRRVPLLLK